MSLDDFLPRYDFYERHLVTVNTLPVDAYSATKELLPREISSIVFMMLAVRNLPNYFLGRYESPYGISKPFLSLLVDNGFILLEDSVQEIVLGMIGQFWKPSGGIDIKLDNPDEFLHFDKPNYAKVAANLSFQSKGDKTLVGTETRIWLPDEKTRKKFAIYWRIISIGSGLIRIMWLNAIKRKAEKE